MIPLELKLRNFMAYRDTSLSFNGIHLAALTGHNGAGKSSLLDAITWAIWGKARARRDDELIRLGQSEMEVELTFGLSDNVYRIVRKRESSGRGRSNLSLHVEDAGGWRTLTETSLRATEAKINALLRLDYDTFINSAFLLQGRADEFTTKRPAERKKILSDILGLEIYDRYAEQAKQQAAQNEQEARIIEARMQDIERELAKEPEYRAQLAAAERDIATVSREKTEAEQTLDLLRERHRAINDKQRQLEDLRDRLKATHTDIADLTQALDAAQRVIDRYQAVLARRADIESGLAQLAQARAAVQDWDNRLQESARLSSRMHQLEQALQQARSRLEADLREATTRAGMLAPKAAAAEGHRQRLAEAQAELAALTALQAELEAKRGGLSELEKEAARLAEQNKQLKLEMDEIKENLTQLEQAGSNCPVCRRELDDHHRAEVLAQFQADGKERGDQWRANNARRAEIDRQQQESSQQVASMEQQLRQLGRLQGQAAKLEQAVAEAEAAAADLTGVQARQAELQQQLDSESYAADVLGDLTEVKGELARLGYDEAAHNQARAEAQALARFETEGRDLADAEQRIKEETARQTKDRGRLERLQAQTEKDSGRVAELEADTAGFTELTEQLNQASFAVDALDRRERTARDQKIMAEQMLGYVAQQAAERGKQADRLEKARYTAALYRELQTAFGKKGVQALLIESAIPEIEDEANRLLSRMTDGRMNVRFETQREAKSGDSTIETLDILIADEAGTRDYELYSGGEAFRINFAIRIAISKVLARRAGAQLQTLMIDEGFGTQDAQGRERLVEAINAIQDDFERLIVITHIDELKDAFPVRIDVWKTPDGSQVAIL
ncbi:MAG: hypothetical protein Kow0031_29020 [Anaerolineae bacterium]